MTKEHNKEEIGMTLEDAKLFVSENRYPVKGKRFISRCIDGRYKNEEGLPALAIPGADLGQMAVIFSAANRYGFEVDGKKALDTLIEVVGGKANFRTHTDSHHEGKGFAKGCGHWGQVLKDKDAYGITEEQIEFINRELKGIGEQVILEGNHSESAVFIIKGSWGILPRFKNSSAFMYHQSLVDERNRELAEKLLEKGAVTLKNNEGVEWLYEALSEVTTTHLLETSNRLAKGLPIYDVNFKDDGSFTIDFRENV
ncbi:hypothetical protein H3C65_03530 [Patescibacteria group bacterium]|nr:hypothetical protein [Patescibacteria group bacterium]